MVTSLTISCKITLSLCFHSFAASSLVPNDDGAGFSLTPSPFVFRLSLYPTKHSIRQTPFSSMIQLRVVGYSILFLILKQLFHSLCIFAFFSISTKLLTEVCIVFLCYPLNPNVQYFLVDFTMSTMSLFTPKTRRFTSTMKCFATKFNDHLYPDFHYQTPPILRSVNPHFGSFLSVFPNDFHLICFRLLH